MSVLLTPNPDLRSDSQSLRINTLSGCPPVLPSRYKIPEFSEPESSEVLMITATFYLPASDIHWLYRTNPVRAYSDYT